MLIHIEVKEGYMKKNILLSVIALIGSSIIFSACSASPQTPTANTTTQNGQTKSYTLSDVSSHNTPQDCWTVIDSGVYNITSYIPNHPGGPQIVSACGTDATSAFNNVGKHQGKATSLLPTYKIGILAK